jgi:hypothetical protein
MSELHFEGWSRGQLIKYLVAHVYPSSGQTYKENVRRALDGQTLETLRNMVRVTYRAEEERREKRRQQRPELRRNDGKHASQTDADHGAK